MIHRVSSCLNKYQHYDMPHYAVPARSIAGVEAVGFVILATEMLDDSVTNLLYGRPEMHV